MTESTELVPTPDERPVSEAGSLARKMSRAVVEMAAYYERTGMSTSQAATFARALAEDTARVMETPPDQISWSTLGRLAEHEPETAEAAWGRILAAAQDELASGHRAADAVEADATPWERARFLQVRSHRHYLNNAYWQLRASYGELRSQPIRKSGLLSTICSAKYFDPGHVKRVDFVRFLDQRDDAVVRIDTYGGRDNPLGLRGWRALPPPDDKDPALLEDGVRGILFGDPTQLVAQSIDAATVVIFGFVMAYAWFKLSNLITPIRVSPETEVEGLDIPEMGALGYPDFHVKGEAH